MDLLTLSIAKKYTDESILGIDGALKGDKGEPGHTPVKGVDYFTDTERQQIIEEVVASGDFSPSIVSNASGAKIALADSANRSFKSLTLYGKTTQQTYTGKNLFNRNYTKSETNVGVTVEWDAEKQEFIFNGTTTSSGDIKIVNPMQIDWIPGEKYTVSVRRVSGTATLASGTNAVTYGWGIFQDNASKFIRGTTGNSVFLDVYNFTATAFELDANRSYIFYFQCWRPGTVFTDYHVKIQIEKGESLTDWEPYVGGMASPNPNYPQELNSVGDNGSVTVKVTSQTDENQQMQTISTPNGLLGIPVESGGNYTDENGQHWICDEIDFGRGVYIQRVGQKTFDGSESWSKTAASKCTQFSTKFSGWLNKTTLLCDQFTVGYDHIVGHCYFDSTNFQVNPYATDAGTVSDWTAHLAEQPLTIVYALATPVETPLTAEQLADFAAMRTRYPTTTVLNDAGADMAIEYVADTKNYIDQKLAAISAALLNA